VEKSQRMGKGGKDKVERSQIQILSNHDRVDTPFPETRKITLDS
jgi:hypothetical protein